MLTSFPVVLTSMNPQIGCFSEFSAIFCYDSHLENGCWLKSLQLDGDNCVAHLMSISSNFLFVLVEFGPTNKTVLKGPENLATLLGAFSLDPLTKGSASGPRWGLSTPVIGWRSALPMVCLHFQIPSAVSDGSKTAAIAYM